MEFDGILMNFGKFLDQQLILGSNIVWFVSEHKQWTMDTHKYVWMIYEIVIVNPIIWQIEISEKQTSNNSRL